MSRSTCSGKNTARHIPSGFNPDGCASWGDVEAGEQGQALVGHQGHDMAFALQRPEFEGQAGAQGMGRGNHFGTRQAASLGQSLHRQAGQMGQEQEQASASGEDMARGQRESAHIGHCFDGRARALGPFLIEAAGQRGEALRLEHLAHRRRTPSIPPPGADRSRGQAARRR